MTILNIQTENDEELHRLLMPPNNDDNDDDHHQNQHHQQRNSHHQHNYYQSTTILIKENTRTSSVAATAIINDPADVADAAAIVNKNSSKAPSFLSSSSKVALLRILWLMCFLLNCKPSEPYLARYLIEVKGLTEDQLDHQVWPWSSYGGILFLIPIGLFTETTLISARNVILGGLLCRECTRLLLLFGHGVPTMAIMQCTYAGSVATDTILFAYVYYLLRDEPDLYTTATAGMYSSYHLGNVVASLIGERLVAAYGVKLQTLFYMSWITTSMAAVLFLTCVPSPPASAVGINDDAPTTKTSSSICSSLSCRNTTRSVTELLILSVHELQELYRIPIIRWISIWSIIIGSSTNIAMNIFQTYFYSLDHTLPAGTIEAGLELILTATAAMVAASTMTRLVVSLRQQQQVSTMSYNNNAKYNIGHKICNGTSYDTNFNEEMVSLRCSKLQNKSCEANTTKSSGTGADVESVVHLVTGGSAVFVAVLYGAGLCLSPSSSLVSSSSSSFSVWNKVIPIILAMGVSGGQITFASVIIAGALGEEEEKREGRRGGRYGLIFSFNKLVELCLTFTLMMGCGMVGHCSSSGYFWLVAYGHLIAAAVATGAFWLRI